MLPFGAVQVGQIKISKWAKLEYRTQYIKRWKIPMGEGEFPEIVHALEEQLGFRHIVVASEEYADR